LQHLPLPVLPSSTHQYIHALYNKSIGELNVKTPEFQAEIDDIICKSFSIDKNQYDYIKGAV
jgi:hypothetical protein